MAYRPETMNEAKLRDVMAEEGIARLRRQAHHEDKRTATVGNARDATASKLAKI